MNLRSFTAGREFYLSEIDEVFESDLIVNAPVTCEDLKIALILNLFIRLISFESRETLIINHTFGHML